MAQVEVRNLKNEVVGKLKLDDAVFEYSASETLVWEAVNAFRAAQRKGTHSTKTRAQVRGGGQKMWRQKGTGRARMGSIRSSIWRKGGTTFGPRPRNYAQAFPKRKRRGAVKLALSDKLKNGLLTVIEDFTLESHKTKEFSALLGILGLAGKTLVVDDRENSNLYLGARNLPRVKMVPTLGVNIYDLVNHQHLLISKRSLLELQEVLKR